MGNSDTSFLNPVPRRRTIFIVLIVSLLVPIILFSIVAPLCGASSVAAYLETIIASLIEGGLALWAIKRDRIPFEKLGLNLSKVREAIILFVIGWVIVAAVLIFPILAGKKNAWDYLGDPLEIIKMWLFVGMAEEFLFRGYLLTRLLRSFERLPKVWSTCAAVLCSSVFFAIYHIPSRLYEQSQGTLSGGLGALFFSLSLVFILGLVMSYFFIRTRNILLCGLLHGSADAPLISGTITIGGITIGVDVVLLAIVFATITEVTLFINKRRQTISARQGSDV